jgi:hypothetical protein
LWSQSACRRREQAPDPKVIYSLIL